MGRDELVDAYLAGQVDRRAFVRRLVALGVSAAAAVTYADVLRPVSAQAKKIAGHDFYTGKGHPKRPKKPKKPH